jgi:cathepsin L
VPPTRNQGNCNSGYAFSVVGHLDTISVLKYNHRANFSAQQIVSCSGNLGNQGCFGG